MLSIRRTSATATTALLAGPRSRHQSLVGASPRPGPSILMMLEPAIAMRHIAGWKRQFRCLPREESHALESVHRGAGVFAWNDRDGTVRIAGRLGLRRLRFPGFEQRAEWPPWSLRRHRSSLCPMQQRSTRRVPPADAERERKERLFPSVPMGSWTIVSADCVPRRRRYVHVHIAAMATHRRSQTHNSCLQLSRAGSRGTLPDLRRAR